MILNDLDTLLFTPSVSGGSLLLNVRNSAVPPVDVAVGTGVEVQDDVEPNTGIITVRIKVFDNGGYVMSVANAAGTWARDEAANPKFSYTNMTVPANNNETEETTVTISTSLASGGTATRSQKIIIRRHTGTF